MTSKIQERVRVTKPEDLVFWWRGRVATSSCRGELGAGVGGEVKQKKN